MDPGNNSEVHFLNLRLDEREQQQRGADDDMQLHFKSSVSGERCVSCYL